MKKGISNSVYFGQRNLYLQLFSLSPINFESQSQVFKFILMIKISIFEAEADFDESVSPAETTFRQQPSSSTRSKRDKFKATPNSLALKQELESKIEINKESYKPHTLRVKRWKNREFGEPRDEDLTNFEELLDVVFKFYNLFLFFYVCLFYL